MSCEVDEETLVEDDHRCCRCPGCLLEQGEEHPAHPAQSPSPMVIW